MLERIAAVDAEVDALLAEPGGGSAAERLAVTAAWEALLRRLPAVTHRLVAELAQVPVEELGEPTLAAALATLLRISKDEAHRRIHEAEDLGPRAAMSGGAARPGAVAYRGRPAARGHRCRAREIIRRFFDRLPGFVDYETREVAEAQLAELACGLKPEELRQAADQLAYLIDQDGQLCDGDRARRRYLSIDKQGPDGCLISAAASIPRPAPRWRRCSPHARRRACATPTTRTRAWMVNRRRRTSAAMPVRQGSATTTRSKRHVKYDHAAIESAGRSLTLLRGHTLHATGHTNDRSQEVGDRGAG